MKVKVALLLAMALTACAFANVGIGISIQNNDHVIYLPINISESFRVEPFIFYSNEEEKDFNSVSTAAYISTGAGLFGRLELLDNLFFLYGGRFSYISSDFIDKGNITYYNFDELGEVFYYKLNLTGYMVAPAIGFEYFLLNRISLGGEVSIGYRSLTGENEVEFNKSEVVNFSVPNEVQSKSQHEKQTFTSSSLIIRFYF